MMNKLCCLIVLFVIATDTSAQITFQKSFYVGQYSYVGGVARQTSDGGFIITGSNCIGLNNNAILIKTNSYGDTLWTRSYSYSSNDFGSDVIQTKDGGYFLAGNFLLKTDSAGQVLWAQYFGEWATSVIESPGGDIIVAGATTGTGSGTQYILLKLDSAGNHIFGETFGLTVPEEAHAVQFTSDGGYIIAGKAGSNSLPQAALIKTDSMGAISWARVYGSGALLDEFNAVKQTSDGGYLALGSTRANTGNINDVYMFLVKVNSNGVLSWSKVYHDISYSRGFSFYETADGYFLLAGTSAVSAHTALLIKIDSLGTVAWAKRYNPSYSNGLTFYSVSATSDSGLILCGANVPVFSSIPSIYLLKTDSSGNAGCFATNLSLAGSNYSPTTAQRVYIPVSFGPLWNITLTVKHLGDSIATLCNSVGINESQDSPLFEIYPNPFSDKINITTETNEPVEITLFDVTSRKLLQQTFTNAVTLNTSQLAKGIYIYEVRNKNGGVKKGKVVKE